MISGGQGLKHGKARRHARAERNRIFATFQIGKTLFERLSIGTVNPAIEEMPGESSIWIAFEGGGSVEGGSDRAGSWVHMPP